MESVPDVWKTVIAHHAWLSNNGASRGMFFADAIAMRRSRKNQKTVQASPMTETPAESRHTVTALEDAPAQTAPQAVGDTTAAAPDRERVAMRAYELYLARGGGEGGALDDWLAAEREFMTPDAERNRE